MRKLGIGMILAAFAVAAAPLAMAATHKTKSHSAAGVVEGWDPSSHVLTIKSPRSTAAFKVGDGTQIWIGSQVGAQDDLAKEQGSKVTVKYTVTDKEKFASTIRISPAGAAHTKS